MRHRNAVAEFGAAGSSPWWRRWILGEADAPPEIEQFEETIADEMQARSLSFDAALADARGHSIETIIPWVEDIDGAPHVRIPEGRGYPVVSEPLATAFRA